jgi:iron(III) transport system permease protein
MLVFAYVVLFLPQAVGAIRTSLLQVNPNVEEPRGRSARPGWRRCGGSRCRWPAAARSPAGAGVPDRAQGAAGDPAARPDRLRHAGDRVWSATEEAFFTRRRGPALLLILLGSVPLAIAMIRERRER